jgi:hypothetical protein
MLGDRKDEWLAVRLEDLDYGDIAGICRAARAYPLQGVGKDELDTALGYFKNNAPHALPLVSPVRPVHRLRRRGSQLEDDHRPAPQAGWHTLNRQRGRRHHRPALPPGQQHLGSHLQQSPHSNALRLTRDAPKMILTTDKIDAHPAHQPQYEHQ